jgi:hypothetical protein
MPRVGSYTGDYLHLSDRELLDSYEIAIDRGGWDIRARQAVQDLRQVILWRMANDERGRVMAKQSKTRKLPREHRPRRKTPAA